MTEPIGRWHFSKNPIQQLKPIPGNQNGGNYYKPSGLWYSAPIDDDGWEHWCKVETFSLESLRWRHEVKLDLSNMIVITDSLGMYDFTRKYRGELRYSHYEIDWKRVEIESAGIEIAPYLWSCRLEPEYFWYYGWDCSSGCVWDESAILSFGPPEAFGD